MKHVSAKNVFYKLCFSSCCATVLALKIESLKGFSSLGRAESQTELLNRIPYSSALCAVMPLLCMLSIIRRLQTVTAYHSNFFDAC
jgi:hypothetical protein